MADRRTPRNGDGAQLPHSARTKFRIGGKLRHNAADEVDAPAAGGVRNASWRITDVSRLAAYLQQIPDEFKLAAAIILGSVILVGLVLFHGMGIHYVLTFHKGADRRLRSGRPHVFSALIVFGAAVFMLLSLHLMGVITWAIALSRLGLVANAHDAIYFCANAYTTLGYGQVDLDQHWRIISPIIGISGLFTFAWTTSALVGIVQAHNALLDQLHEERARQKQLRLDLWHAVRTARSRERAAEADESMEITKESVGAPRFRRWQAWRANRQRIRAMRDAANAQIKGMYRAEQHAEDHLGVPPENPDGIPAAAGAANSTPNSTAPAANSGNKDGAPPSSPPTP
jgi:hypothetical protein